MDLQLEQTDHVKHLAFDAHPLAHSGCSAEDFLGGIRPEDHYPAMLGKIAFLKVAAFTHLQTAHLAIRELDGLDIHGDHSVTTLEAERIVILGAHVLDQRDLIAHCLHIFVKEAYWLARSLASRLHAGLSTPEHDDVVADAKKRIEHAVAHTLAISQQQHHRDQSPNDAQHGQRRAQTVAQQRLPTLDDDLSKFHSGSFLKSFLRSFLAQAFDGAQRRSAVCGIHGRSNSDHGQC